MNNIKEWDDDRLVEEYKEVYDMVYNIECFGTRDLRYLSKLEKELYRRGYRVTSNIEIHKLEPEES